jgi:hypothetical protein
MECYRTLMFKSRSLSPELISCETSVSMFPVLRLFKQLRFKLIVCKVVRLALYFFSRYLLTQWLGHGLGRTSGATPLFSILSQFQD